MELKLTTVNSINIDNTAEILEPSNIRNWGELDIRNGVAIQPFVTILSKKRIEILEGTVIASGVVIVDHDHKISPPYENIKDDGIIEPVSIGRYCWIGANATILKGVHLGDYCIVGAGAVVTRSFPPKSIVAGNPATLLRRRE